MRRLLLLIVTIFILCGCALSQSTNASITGRITDPAKAVLPGARVVAINTSTNLTYQVEADSTGNYTFASLPPGNYRLEVEKQGFKTIVKNDVTLHVQDVAAINFEMSLGSASESITVEGGAPLVDTQDAAVSTVVDRNFAENLPMNGRSFQTLIQLTPGVVVTPSTFSDAGQFSVAGQRPSSNYWTVDGVSANLGTSAAFQGNWVGGSLGSFSALGGTNSLVSVDALQEFRIQTSTYAPEFGRTPGGQISLVTRSGTNQFHGTLFDYLRNDLFDANDWFADAAGLPKPKERQNDFGGTFSGPIIRDRIFFFFSYEGLRLRLPQVALTDVPTIAARQNASPTIQPFLNAFPLPNGPSSGTDQAQFNASFSNPGTLDAYSLRIDGTPSSKLTIFGRYDYSPSEITQRGGTGLALSNLAPVKSIAQTGTIGISWSISQKSTNDFRINYSKATASTHFLLDSFGGAVAPASLGLPTPFTDKNANLFFDVFSLAHGDYEDGQNVNNLQRQINLIDNVTVQKGTHALKFGIDYRRLTPRQVPFLYAQDAFFGDVPSAEAGNLSYYVLQSATETTFLLHDLGLYAQDTWHLVPRLTLTYGLRWDIDHVPSTAHSPNIPAVTGFNVNDLSQLALATGQAPPYRTTYGNFAPRVGLAYEISQNEKWGSVLRGGAGIFYDLATTQLGNLIGQQAYPYSASSFVIGGSYPLSAADAAPPEIVPPGGGTGTILAIDPNLQLPYAVEWNAALEQRLGKQQSASISYVGSVGRRLIQSGYVFSPNPNFVTAILVANTAISDYNALQMQFTRRLSKGLQLLASYTWAHSIDDASEGSVGNSANLLIPGTSPTINRGSSDFDIRHSATAALTYAIPTPKVNSLVNHLLGDWSLESVVQARSAVPVNVFYANFFEIEGGFTQVRPDRVAGEPLYLYGSQYPGGKAFNPAAFTPPPVDAFGEPTRQGNFGRNGLRGFGAFQWDFGIHRDFPIRESLKLQFRAEFFNVLNHPNFGPPNQAIDRPDFGVATQMLGQNLNGGSAGSNVGGGALSPLYQMGGPRSVQFALKLVF